MADEACRIDVWLWRARFLKTRALAARLADDGRIRLARHGRWTRLDKASRTVRPGDELVFAVAGRVAAVRILALGARRGPAGEAARLYAPIDEETGDEETGDDGTGEMRDGESGARGRRADGADLGSD